MLGFIAGESQDGVVGSVCCGRGDVQDRGSCGLWFRDVARVSRGPCTTVMY